MVGEVEDRTEADVVGIVFGHDDTVVKASSIHCQFGYSSSRVLSWTSEGAQPLSHAQRYCLAAEASAASLF